MSWRDSAISCFSHWPRGLSCAPTSNYGLRSQKTSQSNRPKSTRVSRSRGPEQHLDPGPIASNLQTYRLRYVACGSAQMRTAKSSATSHSLPMAEHRGNAITRSQAICRVSSIGNALRTMAIPRPFARLCRCCFAASRSEIGLPGNRQMQSCAKNYCGGFDGRWKLLHQMG